MGWRWWLQVTLAVLVRPTLWCTALAQIGRLARRHWWRRPPFLPLPDPAYLRFRMETAYGSSLDAARVDDVVTYLRWCRRVPA